MSTLKTNNIQHVDRSDPSILLNSDGSVSMGGTVSYEDVTNVDSVGIITARSTIDAQGNVSIADKIIHTGDTNTALRFPAADTFTVETGGSERMRITSDGKLGINESSPDQVLHVKGTGGDTVPVRVESTGVTSRIGFQASGTANSYNVACGASAEDFTVHTSNTEKLRITSDGDLLIGITTGGVGNRLYVVDSFTDAFVNPTDSILRIENANTSGTTGQASISFTSKTTGSNADSAIVSQAEDASGNSRLEFWTDTSNGMTEKLCITSAGRLGLGIAAPTKLLDIATSTSADGIRVKSTGNTYNEIEFDANRTSADNHLGRIVSKWNGGLVSYIAFNTGSDTSNKDDGIIKFHTSASGNSAVERVRIDQAGNIGINEQSPSCKLDIEDGASGGDGITEILRLNGSPNSLNDGIKINFARAGSSCGHIVLEKVNNNNTTDLIISTRASNTVSESMRITGSGTLLVGTPNNTGHALSSSNNSKIQLESASSADYARMSLVYNGADGVGPGFWFGKSRGTSVGSNTIVQDGDQCGGLFFHAADGTDKNSRVAAIVASVDGTPGANDSPGKIVFATCPDGSNGTTNRMTIDSSGNTHFGNGGLNDSNVVSIIPVDGRISFGMDGRDSLVTGESGAYIFSGSGPSGSPLAGELILQSRSNVDRDIFFATGSSPTFRARFRGSDGDLFLGNDLGVITSVGTAFRENDGSLQTYMEMGHSATGANYSYFICRHGGSGTNIGGIAQNSSGNGVTFNTSSDYRLKENVVNITDGITRIKQLTPRRFNWISDETNTLQDGFIAHEVSSIVPEAITGTKDAVENTYYEEEKNLPEGKSVGDVKETDRPVYQAIDQSKLVPLLTAALQEEIAKREALEARVAALES